MNIFFSDCIYGDEIKLSQKESHHCINVKRSKNGDLVEILDGKGTRYIANIIDTSKKSVLLKIKQKEICSNNLPDFHLVISPTKAHDRLDWMIEKATEIGVKKISFVSCKRTERKKINLDRIKRITVSAIKQSGQYYLPEISNMVNYQDLVLSISERQKYIAHLEPDSKQHLSNLYDNSKEICIMIGPEGDFTDEEIDFAKKNGFLSVSLGENTLRTETAGVFSVSLINALDV